MRKLNQRQERFCLEYISGKSATKSAEIAGYSKKAAAVYGHDLLRNPNVLEKIKELQSKLTNDKIMSVQERKEVLSVIGRFGGKLAIPAIAELNKMEKIYSENTGDTYNIDNRKVVLVGDLTDEQLISIVAQSALSSGSSPRVIEPPPSTFSLG